MGVKGIPRALLVFHGRSGPSTNYCVRVWFQDNDIGVGFNGIDRCGNALVTSSAYRALFPPFIETDPPAMPYTVVKRS